MKMNREKLVESLEKIYPAIGISSFVPEYQNFRFFEDTVQATDGVMIAWNLLPQKTDFRFSVPGTPLLSLLKSLKDEEVELILDKTELHVTTDKVVGKFTTLKVEKNLIDSAILKDADLSKTVDGISGERLQDLLDGLDYCRYGVSKDQTAGPLCGVRVEENVIYSTDRYKISRWNLSNPIPGFICSLPLKFVDTMLKFRNNTTDVGCMPDCFCWIKLDDGQTIIYSEVLAGEYRGLGQYFPTAGSPLIMVFDELVDILERHISFLSGVDQVSKEITIEVNKDRCTIVSKDKQLGILKEEIKLGQAIDSKIKFSVNPMFLKDAVKANSTFKYFDKNDLLLVETENGQCLVQITKCEKI